MLLFYFSRIKTTILPITVSSIFYVIFSSVHLLALFYPMPYITNPTIFSSPKILFIHYLYTTSFIILQLIPILLPENFSVFILLFFIIFVNKCFGESSIEIKILIIFYFEAPFINSNMSLFIVNSNGITTITAAYIITNTVVGRISFMLIK